MSKRIANKMADDIVESAKLTWRALTDPAFFDAAPERDDEVILSSGPCETCGDQPLARADGLVIRCPTCKVLR